MRIYRLPQVILAILLLVGLPANALPWTVSGPGSMTLEATGKRAMLDISHSGALDEWQISLQAPEDGLYFLKPIFDSPFFISASPFIEPLTQRPAPAPVAGPCPTQDCIPSPGGFNDWGKLIMFNLLAGDVFGFDLLAGGAGATGGSFALVNATTPKRVAFATANFSGGQSGSGFAPSVTSVPLPASLGFYLLGALWLLFIAPVKRRRLKAA